MRKNKWVWSIVFIVAALGVFVFFVTKTKGAGKESVEEVCPQIGSIQTFISTTGTVLPKNRLEVKPPVNGRVEKILVQEGEMVKAGQILAWMSSTERAVLLDAARGQDEKTVKYWEEVYKPIPLLSPIDGQVIVATTQPAQTVTTADAIVVLSDHLIIRAQVDETDIGKIFLGQKAVVSLDAYADKKTPARVEHIYYESTTVNNVTMYQVDLSTEKVPPFFRSGMNATVDLVESDKQDVLVLPVGAVSQEGKESFVLVKSPRGKEPMPRPVRVGASDDKNIEIISGVTANDVVIMKSKKYVLPKDSTGKNPFMPQRRRR